jgi:hypothetical protein
MESSLQNIEPESAQQQAPLQNILRPPPMRRFPLWNEENSLVSSNEWVHKWCGLRLFNACAMVLGKWMSLRVKASSSGVQKVTIGGASYAASGEISSRLKSV